MPRAIPCLGYRSRTQAVRALTAEGVPDDEIAARIGIDVDRVKSLRAQRRDHCLTVRVPAHTLDRLRPAADARDMPVNALVRQLLAEIVDDGLVDAILDDA